MKRPGAWQTAAALAVATLGLIGCSGTNEAVRLDDAWPERPGSYEDAVERWTRRARADRDFVLVLDAAATLKAPELRAAHTAERARRLGLSSAAHADSIAAEKEAAAAGWEVALLVATGKPEWDDFGAANSIWRVTLIGDGGREVTAGSIVPDDRPYAELASWYPHATRFHRAYVVRFPKTTVDGAPLIGGGSGSRLTLRIASGIARVDLAWIAR